MNPNVVTHAMHAHESRVRSAHSLPPWGPPLALAIFDRFGGGPGEHFVADVLRHDPLFPADWSPAQRRDRVTRLLAGPVEIDGRFLMTARNRGTAATRRYEKTRMVVVRPGVLPRAEPRHAPSPVEMDADGEVIPASEWWFSSRPWAPAEPRPQFAPSPVPTLRSGPSAEQRLAVVETKIDEIIKLLRAEQVLPDIVPPRHYTPRRIPPLVFPGVPWVLPAGDVPGDYYPGTTVCRMLFPQVVGTLRRMPARMLRITETLGAPPSAFEADLGHADRVEASLRLAVVEAHRLVRLAGLEPAAMAPPHADLNCATAYYRCADAWLFQAEEALGLTAVAGDGNRDQEGEEA